MFKKSCLTFLLAVVMAMPVHAEDTKRELAIEHLKVSNTKEILNQTIEAQAQQLSAQKTGMNANELREVLHEAMGWEALKDSMTRIVMEIFTKKELEDINAFYKTESGRALARKSPEFSSKFSTLISRNIREVLRSRSR